MVEPGRGGRMMAGSAARGAFTLIELMIVVAIIAAIAAIAVPNLLSSRMASNETASIAALRAYLGAQGTFHCADRYGVRAHVYANESDGAGFPDLFEIGYAGGAPTADALQLVDMAFAQADVDMATTVPKSGYIFDDVTGDAITGNYDYAVSCGLAACPGTHGKTGLNSYIVDITGVVYKKDLGAGQISPPTTYPDMSAESWLAVNE